MNSHLAQQQIVKPMSFSRVCGGCHEQRSMPFIVGLRVRPGHVHFSLGQKYGSLKQMLVEDSYNSLYPPLFDNTFCTILYRNMAY